MDTHSEHSESSGLFKRQCAICLEVFHKLFEKSVCRICERTVCEKHYTKRTHHKFEDKKPHKVCTSCGLHYETSLYISSFISKNSIKWNKNSKIGETWLARLNAKKILLNDHSQPYQDLIIKATSLGDDYGPFETILKDVKTGRSDRDTFCPSIGEFMEGSQGALSVDVMRYSIMNVLKAYVLNYPKIGYCQGMSHIVCFLMNFLEEENCFWLFCYLVHHILPQDYFADVGKGNEMNGVFAEKYILQNLIVKKFKMTSEESKRIDKSLDYLIFAVLAPILMNSLRFDCQFLVFDNLFSNEGFNAVRKILLMICSKYKNELLDPTLLDPKIFDPEVINVKAFQDKLLNFLEFKDLENALNEKIDIKEVEVYREEYLKKFSEKWSSDTAQIIHSLYKISHFDKNEIKQLQNLYVEFEKTEKSSGITKENFIKVIQVIVEQDEKKAVFLTEIDLDEAFEMFDFDSSHSLDFREFICLISVLLRGSAEEKIKFMFYILDKDEKNYLTPEEFDKLVNKILKTFFKVEPKEITPGDDSYLFMDEMNMFKANKDKFMYADVMEKILKNETLVSLATSDSSPVLKHKVTIAKLTEGLNLKTSEL